MNSGIPGISDECGRVPEALARLRCLMEKARVAAKRAGTPLSFLGPERPGFRPEPRLKRCV
jgi:hypothetical protein